LIGGFEVTPTAFYPRWIVANGWSEAIGLGTTFLIGRRLLAPSLASPGPTEILLGAVAAVVLGSLLEGLVVGAAQERVLRGVLAGLRPGAWAAATAAGAGAAWLIGMIPSTVLGLTTSSGPSVAPPEPPVLVQNALAVLLGLVTGPILGSVQAWVLRRHTPRASRWLGANAVAWALGMPVIFLGMDLVPWSRGGVAVALAIYAVCGVAGTLVGAVHGRILRDMISSR